MKPTKLSSPKYVPPDTWDVHSPYGLLKSANGDYLERLEAVHALLMQRDGLTSMEAAVRVFGPFIFDANSEIGSKHGVEKLRRFLYIADASERAMAIGDHAGRLHLDKAADTLPYVPHHRLDRGTPAALFYAMGVMAGEVWAPHSGDVDINTRLDGYSPEGYFPNAEKCREIVGPLAVSHALAHSLWGWGLVAEVVPLKVVPNAQQSLAPPIPRKIPQRELAPEWTSERLLKRQNELKVEALTQGKKSRHTALLAKECGLPDREITRRISHPSGAMRSMSTELTKARVKK